VVAGEAVPVDVWFVPSGRSGDGDDEATFGLLSADERARAGRFVRPDDRATYVAAHVALRRLAGARVGLDPAALRLGCDDCPLCGGPHGRPTLLDPPIGGGTELSLSRTTDLAAVALSPVVVGVDVEVTTRDVDLDDLLVALHPHELPVADRTAALRLWVRKEAYLKGLGTGLGVDPAGVDLSTDPPGWQVVDLPAGPGVLAAVAVRTTAQVALTVRPCGQATAWTSTSDPA
jgi:4'-phosphopantetheinyl transferase